MPGAFSLLFGARCRAASEARVLLLLSVFLMPNSGDLCAGYLCEGAGRKDVKGMAKARIAVENKKMAVEGSC